MGITIRDVASEAGVSIATVSRALRGHTNISLRTREHVSEVAQRLGYELPDRPHPPTKSNITKIALVAPFIGRWYFAKMIEGIELITRERGFETFIFRPSDSAGQQLDWVEHLEHFNVQGAIIVTQPLSEQDVERLAQRGVPSVLVGLHQPGFTSVGIDDVEVGRIATEHLLDLGHRRIAIITGYENDPYNFRTPRDRLTGYEAALRQRGITPEPAYRLHSDFTAPSAYHEALEALSRPDRPTAIFAASDEMAVGVLGAARHLGLRIPEDLSVIGVDDHEVAEALGLTTIAQPVATIAEVAAWQLISRLTTPVKTPPARVLLPVQLIERATTAALT